MILYKHRYWTWSCFLLPLAIFLAGCSPSYKELYTRAEVAYNQGDVNDALIELRSFNEYLIDKINSGNDSAYLLQARLITVIRLYEISETFSDHDELDRLLNEINEINYILAAEKFQKIEHGSETLVDLVKYVRATRLDNSGNQ